ncbi:MAG: hypothetical protein HC938_16420 [Nitrospira sp.]|nr:hypothetical protein [Nitrospira sp.]
MDRARAQVKSLSMKRVAIIGDGRRRARDRCGLGQRRFRCYRVERDRISIETVERGMMEIRVGADGRLQSDNVEQLAAQVSGA